MDIFYVWFIDLWNRQPQAIVTFVVFLASIITFLITSHQNRKLQHRRNYVDLEFEASRIFQVCVNNPEIPAYLEGAPFDSKTGQLTPERVYWFVCQVLNVFEIIISFRKEKMVTSDLFNTWVSWFHELGTAERFGEFWEDEEIWSHYKEDLQKIMNTARALRLKRRRDIEFDNRNYNDEMRVFHHEVAIILDDPSIEKHFEASLQRNSEFSASIGG